MLDMPLLMLRWPLALAQSKVDSLASSFRNCVTEAMLCKLALCLLTDNNAKCCIYIGIKLCSVTLVLHHHLWFSYFVIMIIKWSRIYIVNIYKYVGLMLSHFFNILDNTGFCIIFSVTNM